MLIACLFVRLILCCQVTQFRCCIDIKLRCYIISMIAKILNGSASFAGVSYNTNKIDRNKGELMLAANFGPLQGLAKLRPQDYVNYLKMIAALNKNISDPQFHATLSAKEKSYDKHTLTKVAVDWMKEMGYGKQPYLVVFHKDTGNNHVHLVSVRIDRDGVKIPSGFEKRRAVKNINKVLGYEFAYGYKFSTRAQFFMLLENAGYSGVDPNEQLIREKIDSYKINKERAVQIKGLLEGMKQDPDLIQKLKDLHGIDLIFHAAEGKKPYGYSIIDHQEKTVFKGSEVYSLKYLLNAADSKNSFTEPDHKAGELPVVTTSVGSIRIADDVDDQQIHGMRRRRQKKARTNTR